MIRAVRLPVVRPRAGSLPLWIMAFAPIQEISSMHRYMQDCIRGIFRVMIRSAFEKSL